MLSAAFLAQIVALLVTLILVGCEAAAQPPASAPERVDVEPVIVKPLRQWDNFTGRLEASDAVGIRHRVAGQISDAPFTDGADVKSRQLLFKIDPRPFQDEVDRLRAQTDQAKAKSQLAQADSDRAQRLYAQNAIAKEEAERLVADARSASAKLGAAEASLRAAKLNLSLTRVVSPIDGRVSKAMITPGNLVTTGPPDDGGVRHADLRGLRHGRAELP